jgi:hypothetical protein
LHPEYKVIGRSAEVFFRTIYDGGIRFVVDRHPTECPHCTDGPDNKRRLSELDAQIQSRQLAKGSKELKEANDQLRLLRHQVADYERHLKQWEVPCCTFLSLVPPSPQFVVAQKQRKRINGKIIDLAHHPGHAVVIEDFVSRYANGLPCFACWLF